MRQVFVLMQAGQAEKSLELDSQNDPLQRTPLHIALCGHKAERAHWVKELLSNGADVARRDVQGHTVLHTAARRRALLSILQKTNLLTRIQCKPYVMITV